MYRLTQMNKSCAKCPELVTSRKRITWGYGDPKSPVMFIGEAPGYLGCDVTGIPFTRDRSGEFFQKMLSKINYSKETVYTTNVVKCCPPGNRTPTSTEAVNCRIYLEYELRKVSPKLTVLLGKPAMQSFFPLYTQMLANWGKLIEDHSMYNTTFMMLPHPAYVVRNLIDLEHIYLKSFKKIKQLIEEEQGNVDQSNEDREDRSGSQA